ncbi:MAG: peptidoglycan-N-acetylglucosamine deacetylase [Verrucomicrobiota bacterium]|jgi:peptidoglycan/xylan/chitin deacetylase (PgdA/CDA1 family)
MRAFRLLVFLALISVQGATGQSNRTAPDSQKTKPDVAPAATPAEPPITFNWVHVDGPYIALTFDDGPNDQLTPKLLDLLAAHHIKATFFVLGELVNTYPEIVQRAAREGHEIGNHSWSHPNLAKLSDEGVRQQLQKTDDAIKSATGSRPTLMRPPYGNLSDRQKRWVHKDFGYKIILWDVDPLDWKRPGPKVVCARIVKETRAGSIVLSHDIHPGTIEAMPATLEELEAKGFKFVTVSELIAMATPVPPKPPAPKPARSTSSPVATPGQ